MKEICIIKKDEDKTITLVESNHIRYIQKELKYYDKNVYIQLQKLKNPYLPKIYVVQEKNHILTILEEYIEGETLENKTFEIQEAKNIMHQLCICLKPIHNMHIIHRDIKPENIIYHNHKVTLIDFGIARFQDETKSKDTQILGSIGYAAPEQFGFEQSNPQTDIYALGKLFNVLLNGTLDQQDNIPINIQHIIHKACQLDYNNRYNSVSELDSAIHNRYVIFPGINNDSFQGKFFCWIYIFFAFYIAYNDNNMTFDHLTIDRIAMLIFMYFPLWLFFNKNLFSKYTQNKSWALTYIIIWILFSLSEITFFLMIDSLF